MPSSSPDAASTPDAPDTSDAHPPTHRALADLVTAVARGSAEFEELIAALMPYLRDGRELPPEVALELSTALIALEKASSLDDQLFALVNTHGAAAVALAPSGQILAANGAAVALFALSTGDGLSALGISRSAFEQFEHRLSRNPGATLVRGHVRRAAGASGTSRRDNPILLSGTYSPGYRAFVLKALQNYWPDSVDTALHELYGLSASEREILSGLARGMSSEAIARERYRSVGTVRQQIKSVMHKMGVTTQLEAATTAAAAAATATAAVETAGRTIGRLPHGPNELPLEFGSFVRAGRLVGHRRFGVANGSPVLLVHGPSFGAGEYPHDRKLAIEHRLDVHAVERPGYGRTQSPARDGEILACHTDDIMAYLDRSELSRVTILAHEVGLIPALAVAHRAPERIRGIVSVSAAPPFRELEQINVMPGHQGIFVQSAREAPWLARLMTRLLTFRTRRLGVEHWTDVIFKGLDPDGRVMRRPALRAGIIGTYSFYLNQMGLGFEHDLELMLTDWSPLVEEASIPVHLLHGCRNPTTPTAYLNIFTSMNPEIRVTIVEDAGLTLALSHPTTIYGTLAELADGS